MISNIGILNERDMNLKIMKLLRDMKYRDID